MNFLTKIKNLLKKEINTDWRIVALDLNQDNDELRNQMKALIQENVDLKKIYKCIRRKKMFEPSITSQILGTGAVILGFIVVGILSAQMDKQEQEKKRKQEEEDTRAVHEFNKIVEIGRKIERQEIRKNIRREFPGFTFDNERPEGLRPEPLALPEPK